MKTGILHPHTHVIRASIPFPSKMWIMVKRRIMRHLQIHHLSLI